MYAPWNGCVSGVAIIWIMNFVMTVGSQCYTACETSDLLTIGIGTSILPEKSFPVWSCYRCTGKQHVVLMCWGCDRMSFWHKRSSSLSWPRGLVRQQSELVRSVFTSVYGTLKVAHVGATKVWTQSWTTEKQTRNETRWSILKLSKCRRNRLSKRRHWR